MMYVSQIIMLYTLNLYKAICQLQLKEIERTEIKERKRERERKRDKERKKETRKKRREREQGREEVTEKKKKKSNGDISGMYVDSDLLTWVLWIHYLPRGC